MSIENTYAARQQTDRRRNHFKSLLYSFVKRRRKSFRRSTDSTANIYVDVHDPLTVVLFLAVIIFCVADAIMTLFIIKYGGEEVNPFMKYLMDKDIMMFFWVKFTLTSFGMLFLVAHKYFIFYQKIHGMHVIRTIFAMYLTLIVYELVILTYQID